MKARTVIAALATAATLPVVAHAGLSPVYQRPLDSCTAAINTQFNDAEVTDTFHRRLDSGRHEIFANVETRAENGTKEHQRVTCETSRSGHMVIDVSSAAGRWVDDQG
ncbi:MAG: hypothetical protein VX766_05220 [Pseudomonadota bacterium]|nr:hypothetical protein [Pseudomonadota bacterium]